jgi:antitoxin StbD
MKSGSSDSFARLDQFEANEQAAEARAQQVDLTGCWGYVSVMKLDQVLADASISISELKKNPSAVIEAANGFPVAILNRNTPSAYLVPAAAWEALMDHLDNLELVELIRQREHEEPVRVSLDDLRA